MTDARARTGSAGIWLLAFGYFAAYAPYSALTKALSGGKIGGTPLDGFAILPMSALASTVLMAATLVGLRWLGYASSFSLFGLRIPRPGPLTFLSGLTSAAIILTTTLAYTFEGTSIVLMMVLLRGGVLVIAPIVDLLTGRKVRWYSWVALALSIAALADMLPSARADMTLGAGIDVLVYVASYFVRLRLMSKLAKTKDVATNRKYFVEEQLVASPAAVLALGLWALLGWGHVAGALRDGFTGVPRGPLFGWVLLVGALSQGTGLFGGLVLLDARESSFAVPVNRASSLLAGLVATTSLFLLGLAEAPSVYEMIGAGLVVGAVVVLAVGPSLSRPKPAVAGA